MRERSEIVDALGRINQIAHDVCVEKRCAGETSEEVLSIKVMRGEGKKLMKDWYSQLSEVEQRATCQGEAEKSEVKTVKELEKALADELEVLDVDEGESKL